MTALLILICRVFDIIARFVLFGMASLVLISVVLRRIGLPLAFTYDLVGLMMVIVTSFALAQCAVAKVHVAVGFILDRFSLHTQLIVDIITNILAVALFGTITWQCCVYARTMWLTGEVVSTLPIGYYVFIYLLVGALLLLTFELVVDLANSLRRFIRL